MKTCINAAGSSGMSLIAVALTVFGISAYAADIVETVFPGAGGDLANAAAWGGTLPGTDAHLVLANPGTYTLFSAAEFASIRQSGAGDFVFDFTEADGWLTLNDCSGKNGGSSSIFCFPNDQRTSPCSTTFKGGTWYHSAGTKDFGIVATKFGNDYSVTLTDGCVITNINNFNVSWMMNGFTMTIEDNSRVYAEGRLNVARQSGTNNVLRVCSGSKIHAGSIYMDSSAEGVWKNTLFDIRDEGTKVSTSSFLNGFHARGNTVRVRDSASLDLLGGTLRLGYLSTSKSNALEVLNLAVVTAKSLTLDSDGANRVQVSNATITASETISLASAPQLGNRLDVMDEAQVAAAKLYVGTNCTLSVSDASLTVNSFSCCSNCVIRVSGADSVFSSTAGTDWPSSGIFADGHISMILDDGYSASSGGHISYICSPGNLLRIMNGAELDFSSVNHTESDRLHIGSSSTMEKTRDNRIEVLDEGTLKTDSFFVWGYDNTIVVSNGTLVTGSSSTSAIWIGYGGPSSNVTLVVAGTNPVIRCHDSSLEHGIGRFSMQRQSVLRYEIPEEGYPKGHVPFIATTATISEGCRLEVECEKWAANGGIEGNKLVLFRSPSDIDDFADMVTECSETLPPGATLAIEGNELVLRREKRGFRIILR